MRTWRKYLRSSSYHVWIMFGVITLSVSALAVCCGANAYRMCVKLFGKEEHVMTIVSQLISCQTFIWLANFWGHHWIFRCAPILRRDRIGTRLTWDIHFGANALPMRVFAEFGKFVAVGTRYATLLALSFCLASHSSCILPISWPTDIEARRVKLPSVECWWSSGYQVLQQLPPLSKCFGLFRFCHSVCTMCIQIRFKYFVNLCHQINSTSACST